MPASMRALTYSPEIAFTSDELISTKCNCQAGAKLDTDRGNCVHILPILLQTLLLLFNGLAQNILVELSHRWDCELESTIDSIGKISEVKRNLRTLMLACGQELDKQTNDRSSVKDMLEGFAVGTEKTKMQIQQPKEDELIPLSELKRISNNQMIKERLLQKRQRVGNNVATNNYASSSHADVNVDNCNDRSPQKNNTNDRNANNNNNRTSSLATTNATHTLTKTLERDIYGTIKPIQCDFCKSSTGPLTTHVCRLKITNGPYCMIDGEDEKICGLATCVLCSEKLGHACSRDRCFHHFKSSNSASNNNVYYGERVVGGHPEVVKEANANENRERDANQEEEDPEEKEVEEYVDRPQYLKIKKHIDGLLQCYEHTTQPDTAGMKLLQLRALRTTFTQNYENDCGDSSNKLWKDAFNNAEIRSLSKQKKKKDSIPIQVSPKYNVSSTDTLLQALSTTPENQSTTQQTSETVPINTSAYQSPSISTPKSKKKQTSGRYHCKCGFLNCKMNDSMPGVYLTRVPPPPTKSMTNLEKGKLRDVRTYFQKQLHHAHFCKRMGIKGFAKKGIRICNKHKMEEIKVTKTFKRKNEDRKETFTFIVPCSDGVQSLQQHNESSVSYNDQSRKRREPVYERVFMNQIKKYRTELVSEHGEKGADTIEELQKMVHQLTEENEKLTNRLCMAPNTPSQMGDRVKQYHTGMARTPLSNKKRSRFQFRKQQQVRPKARTKKDPHQPEFLPNMATDEIKRRTGFRDEVAMLSFTILACNGDFEIMQKTRSILTWYEEWLMFYEMLWGRTHTRLIDIVKMFWIRDENTVIKIFDSKIQLVMKCREIWPTYASYEEDKMLRKEKWNGKYEGKRVVMWDDTNLPFQFKPTAALSQRITWSNYYSQNCAKGGVFLQLCDWLGVDNLWVGATSDSVYQQKTEIFKRQDAFARNDKVGQQVIPFTNIFDKGYRCVLDAWRAGRQECIQPIFAQSDRTFHSDETLISASIAADRSGNERAVNVCKRSGYLKRGLKAHQSPIRMNNAWCAWSFMANFMYQPVL